MNTWQRSLVTLGTVAVGAVGTVGIAKAINSFLPRRFATWYEPEETGNDEETSSFPDIEVSFLRCGSVAVPELIAVRGAFSLAPRLISHSAVLIRHPKATFLYDTGLSTDIHLYLQDQSFFFRNVLGRFTFEQSLRSYLQGLNMRPDDLDFALISHLHWDHVSGVPDIPRVPLHINRIEYEAARQTFFVRQQGLPRQLIGDNPIELFDCSGPSYAGFHASYDLFGDGSVVLVPLPGHTPGNTGMFINRANGSRLLLLGDAVWVAENYLYPAPMHPFIWSAVTSDDATASQTLIDLYHFSRRHPEIVLVAMHDARAQETFMQVEQARLTRTR